MRTLDTGPPLAPHFGFKGRRLFEMRLPIHCTFGGFGCRTVNTEINCAGTWASDWNVIISYLNVTFCPAPDVNMLIKLVYDYRVSCLEQPFVQSSIYFQMDSDQASS